MGIYAETRRGSNFSFRAPILRQSLTNVSVVGAVRPPVSGRPAEQPTMGLGLGLKPPPPCSARFNDDRCTLYACW